jgi:hypothetical protein
VIVVEFGGMKLQDALTFVDKHGVAMLRAPGSNLRAVAVSSKAGVAITEATDFTVTGYVARKLTPREMQAAAVAPFNKVFTAVGGPTLSTADFDVVESGSDFRPLPGLSVPATLHGVYGGLPPGLDAQKYFESLRCGIGITNPFDYPTNLSVGTLGFFVRDPRDVVYLVSNNHVIGRSSAATGAAAVRGESVVQPGTLDLSAVELRALPTRRALERQLKIATVAAVVPLEFIPPPPAGVIPVNRVDAALARLHARSGRRLVDLDRLTYGGALRGTAALRVDPVNNRVIGDSRVFKVARTTGYTEGTATIGYGPGQDAYFAGQFVVQATPDNVGPFSNSGDSGSGVLNSHSELIGMLFAGSQLQTLVNPVADVLAALTAVLGKPSLSVVTG